MKRPPLPAIGAGEPHSTLRFLEHVCRRDTFHRIEMMSEWEKVRLYTLYNKQWLRPDYGWGDTTRTPFWEPIPVPPGRFFPMPVHNALVEPLQNESARLLGAGYEWNVRPDDSSPRKQYAAHEALDVLKSLKDDLRWQLIEQEGVNQAVLFGTWIFKTGWESSFVDTVRLPVPTAVRCTNAGCSFRLAKPAAPLGSNPKTTALLMNPKMQNRYVARGGSTDVNDSGFLENTAKSVTITGCLSCGAGNGSASSQAAAPLAPLSPYSPSADEAKEAKDYFDRPMGIDVPRGNVYIENIPCYDFFPENDSQTPLWRLREWAEEKIVPIEYIQDRWYNGRLVEPENVMSLLKWHPIVSTMHGWSDMGAWDHHNVIRVYHRKPQVVWDDETKAKYLDTGEITVDRGRSVVMAGRHVMLDDHYQVESQEHPGQYVDRVKYHIFPWEIREGETFGLGAGPLGLPIQDTINTRLAQVQYVRHVFGNPKLVAAQGAELYQAGYEDTGYAGDVMYYNADVGGEVPKVVQGTQLQMNWLEEHKADLEGIARSIGTNDTEVGMPPGAGVTAASAIMHFTRQAGTRRQPRVERRATVMAEAGKHLLQWVHEAYREERHYRVSGPGGRLAVKAFTGADLMGQFDVKVTVRPAYDSPEFRQQSLMDAVDKGIITPTTAADKKRLATELGAPTDVVNADTNRQVEIAEDEFVAFYIEGRAPVVRLRGDDHVIHGQQHLLDWMSKDMERRKDAVAWYEAEQALDGWQEKWAILQETEARLKAQPPEAGPQMPPANPITGEITATDMARQVDNWQHDYEAQQKLKTLPQPLELKLYAFMSAIVKPALFPQGQTPDVSVPPYPTQPDSSEDAPKPRTDRATEILSLLRFFVHLEAHLQKAQAEQQAAQAGVELPAPPGGREDASGMIPGKPSEARGGAGAGPTSATAGGAGATGPGASGAPPTSSR